MLHTADAGAVTGTKDKDYNLLWYTAGHASTTRCGSSSTSMRQSRTVTTSSPSCSGGPKLTAGRLLCASR